MKRIDVHRKNLAKHGVTVSEAEEALYDGWARRRRAQAYYEVLGRTGSGRYLQLVIEILPEVVRIFHGRDMDGSERKRYGKK